VRLKEILMFANGNLDSYILRPYKNNCAEFHPKLSFEPVKFFLNIRLCISFFVNMAPGLQSS
jgi:hypothetical protein